MAKDRFHDVVKIALEKDGWTITHDPFELKAGGVEMEIDLGAERLLAAEREDQKIAIEVKSFLASTSTISEFHRALGQFLNYQLALRVVDSARVLYLAVPSSTYDDFFRRELPRLAIEEYKIRLIAYDVSSQEIVAWER